MCPVYLNARDLALKLRVTVGTVLRWARQGQIPSIRPARRPVLFDADEVAHALRARAARQVAAQAPVEQPPLPSAKETP